MSEAIKKLTTDELVRAAKNQREWALRWERQGAGLFARSSEKSARRYEDELWERGLDPQGEALQGNDAWDRKYWWIYPLIIVAIVVVGATIGIIAGNGGFQ